jgi:hypothetical protein
MRARLLVCLGMTMLAPVAAAETRTKVATPAPSSTISTGSTNQAVNGRSLPYAIIANAGDKTKRSFAVQLERRVTENDLKRIALDIRLTDMGIEGASAVVMFYLPSMKLGHGMWAHAYFPATETPEQKATQEPKVTITGLSIADEEQMVLSARQDRRNLVGVWLTAAPAPAGKLTLFREKGRLFSEWGLRDGTRFTEEVIETALAEGGWRYDRRDGGGADHMRMSPEGDLELRDRNDVITHTQTIKRQPGDFNLAIAKSNQTKSTETQVSDNTLSEKAVTDKTATRKLSGTAIKGTITVTTVGSATTTAATDKATKTKTALPVEQAGDPDALANVIFR